MPRIFQSFNLRQLAFLLIVAIVPLFFWLSSKVTHELVNSRAWLEHTYGVLEHLHGLRAELDTLEIGRKGYFIRRNTEHLQQFHQARSGIPQQIAVLQGMTRDNAYQQARLEQLDKTVALLLEETANNIAELEENNIAYPAYSNKALPLLERSRFVLGEIHAHENAVLKSRLANSAGKQSQLSLMLALMGVSFLLLLGFVLNNMYREIRQRRKVEAGLLASQMQNQETVHNLSLMGEMSNLLQACSQVDESLEVIRQFAMQLLNADAGAIYLFCESGNQIEEKISWGNELKSDPIFQPDDCWALRRGEPHMTGGTHDSLACRHQHDAAGAYSLCIPIVAQGNVLGILHLENPQGHALDEVQRKLASALASQVALAMASMKLRETLRNLSVRDPLTGLFNRRYMEESLQRELAIAHRKQRSLGVVILDLDHFKTFNDTFGHDAGDCLLREVGALLVSSSRSSDIVCRFGGEEFLLIFPETSAEIVLERTEHLRQLIFALQLQHFGRSLGQVSASFGLAFFPEHATSAEELLRLADKALYRAKAAGRNRVEVASGA
ncbi:diguanylate cyclase [Methylobacillus arboreus]|uniref:sensor domain-containing diguanylate cyclase n=1 Tax=Methylobacillus arboreus TaxID=755170 RepID=UPI001E3125A0|nr:diguanylate cyclase [Methylobacillus arboreus]MCB5191794.1 diguanylate cyclase [Methylobacillus arboreus]